MNTKHSHSEAVWESTLPQIRSTRRRRAYRRAICATAACGALAAIWLMPEPQSPAHSPVAEVEPDPPVHETIAVMRIDDHGTVRLEEVASSELGQVELVFGQAPLVSWEFN